MSHINYRNDDFPLGSVIRGSKRWLGGNHNSRHRKAQMKFFSKSGGVFGFQKRIGGARVWRGDLTQPH